MASPVKLSHIVLQTNDVSGLRNWYTRVLDAHPQFDNGSFCFLAYDDEHHRIGIVRMGDHGARDDAAAGMHHVSFTFAGLPTLLEKYEQLAAEGITPVMCLNHGPTVSIYYGDPDGNRVELQVDVFATNDEVNAFLAGPIYRNDPIGQAFDPAEMLRLLRAGAPESELMRRAV